MAIRRPASTTPARENPGERQRPQFGFGKRQRRYLPVRPKVQLSSSDVQYKLQWWGYEHTNGSVQVKRFFDYRDIAEARESSFVHRVMLPFFAQTREEALAAATAAFAQGTPL